MAHVAPLAHIIQGSGLPITLGWVSACLIAAGGAAIFRGRGTVLEAAGWVTFTLAFLGAGAVVVVTAFLPTTAAITIAMATPHSGTVTSPLQVVVCGRDIKGNPGPAPDGTNVLAVVLDGRELAVEHTGTFAVEVPAGRHHLRVELLTRDHYVFSPPVTADTTITVEGAAPLGIPAACPTR